MIKVNPRYIFNQEDLKFYGYISSDGQPYVVCSTCQNERWQLWYRMRSKNGVAYRSYITIPCSSCRRSDYYSVREGLNQRVVYERIPGGCAQFSGERVLRDGKYVNRINGNEDEAE